MILEILRLSNTPLLYVPTDLDRGTIRNEKKHRNSCTKNRKKRKNKRR